jgi:kynurenine formamidase
MCNLIVLRVENKVIKIYERLDVIVKFVDLSITLENDLPGEPEITRPKISYKTHKETLGAFPAVTKGVITVDDVPEGLGYGDEMIMAGGHATTHVDAPWHYRPTMNKGQKAWTIDEVPVEWFYGHGVCIDFSDKPDGYMVSAKDFEEALKKIDYELKPGDIVLVHTGAKFGTEEYTLTGCGMGKEATLWLTDRGVRVCGTDAWGWDPPMIYQAKEFEKTKNRDAIWQGHRAGLEVAYCHIEKLTNLDKLPPYGFTVCCFPVKVKGGSAGWTRAVAIFND